MLVVVSQAAPLGLLAQSEFAAHWAQSPEAAQAVFAELIPGQFALVVQAKHSPLRPQVGAEVEHWASKVQPVQVPMLQILEEQWESELQRRPMEQREVEAPQQFPEEGSQMGPLELPTQSVSVTPLLVIFKR